MADGQTMSDLFRLEKFLFNEYTKIHRPVKDSGQPVDVHYDMALEQLIEVVCLFNSINLRIFNFSIPSHDT